MPFYKWIIDTGQSSRQKELGYYSLNDDKTDVNAVANRQMVQTIRHLSQLAGIAHDIFGAIENDCLIVLQRTSKLKDKIQYCRSIVDNLNAKTVPVPVSTLSDPQEFVTPFASSHVDAKSPIFSTYPRPPEVDRLRQLANGPSPPAFIPSTMIADGEQRTSSATHIYCQPLEQSVSSSNSIMTSTIKVPSTIVPIDISGQPFSRMASFRRSFIHVDFFIRRKKKKDKRRNTVTEGDTKELKDALQNIINEKSKNPSNHENYNMQEDDSSKINKMVNGEKNNNSSDKSICSAPKSRNCFQLDTNSEVRNMINTSKNETEKLDLKNHYNSEIKQLSSLSKRRTKGRIPISTVSAAMSVAVEMRQLNGNNKLEDQSSSGNWSYSSDPNSSDSENRRNSVENNGKEIVSEIDSNDSSLSRENLQHRLKEIDASVTIPNTKVTNENKEIESSSCASSENNGIMDDATSNATSADSEVFFISSDESDEEISDLTFEPNYGSSLSLTTASNGSLNSLLSQTATEMASSTGTLTSIGLDRLPTPPPPPPIIITATANRQIITTIDKNLPIQTKNNSQIKHSSKKESKPLIQKNSKPVKAEKTDILKNSTENTKNIFTSLVNMKTRTKDRNKFKNSEKINKTLIQPPLINMYGCDSPQNIKQQPLFIKENASIIKNEPKNCMQSFSSNATQLKTKILSENKLNFEKLEPKLETKLNPSIHETNINSTRAYHSEGRDVEVPLKYVHRVTVTPIQRQLSEQSKSVTCRKTLFKESEQRMVKDNDFKQNINLNTFQGEQHCFEKQKPQRPMTLQPEKPKAAARVLLDSEGRVVQCTNSLDRKVHYVAPPEKYNYTTHVGHIRNQVVTNESAIYNPICNQTRSFQSPLNAYQLNDGIINRRYSSPFATMQTRYEPDVFGMVQNDHSISQQNYTEHFHGHHVQGNNSFYITDKAATTQKAYEAQSLPRQKFQVPRKSPLVLTPDPNISGLPLNDTLLTQRNVKIHSKQMEKYSMPGSITTTNSVESYTTSPKSLNSPITTEINKSPTTMSTEDLFAVIHNCKKRMNIKTDSDISLASSSRSSSPSYLRPISAKGTLAETGFLSPRNSSSFDSRDRRSWADFRPSRETCGERKSLASDRLGPTKPTSMHDFKMLLLQTRSNSQILGPRKSAVEMLKVPVPCDRNIGNNSLPLNFSPQNLSHSVPNSPSSEYYLCNGHSTVPFKRNSRARSSLQPRYTMYPPIFEDCLEDSENNRDIQQNAEKYIDVYKNTCMQHNDNGLYENTSQNLRHWV